MTNTKITYFRIPANLEQFLIGKLTEINQLKNIYKYYWFIHTIRETRMFDRRDKKSGFSKLHSNILKSILTKQYYKTLINNLLKWHVILEDKGYLVGGHSKGYKLTAEYLCSFEVKIEVLDNKLLTRILTHKDKFKSNKTIINNTFMCTLSKSNTLKKYAKLMRIDTIQARNYIDSLKATIKDRITVYKNPTTGKVTEYDKIAIYERMIDSIENKTDFFIDDVRIYTHLTQMLSELRQFIYFEGINEEIWTLDIKSSQVVMAYILSTVWSGKEDLNLKNILETEDFYSVLNDKGYTREQFKEYFFRYFLFCSKKVNLKNKFSLAIKDKFPILYNWVLYSKKENYKNCAHECTKLESSIVLDSTAIPLSLFTDVFVSTIHDAIITTKSNLKTVKKRLLYIFKVYNIKPQIKEEYMNNKIINNNKNTTIPLCVPFSEPSKAIKEDIIRLTKEIQEVLAEEGTFNIMTEEIIKKLVILTPKQLKLRGDVVLNLGLLKFTKQEHKYDGNKSIHKSNPSLGTSYGQHLK